MGDYLTALRASVPVFGQQPANDEGWGLFADGAAAPPGSTVQAPGASAAGPGAANDNVAKRASSAAGVLGMGELESAGGIPPEVLARSGLVFDHDGGYAYEITATGGFQIVKAPEDRGIGFEITPGGEFASAWQTLADFVVAMGPSSGQAAGGGLHQHREPPKRGVPWGERPAPGAPAGGHAGDDKPKTPSDDPSKEPEGPSGPGKSPTGGTPKAPEQGDTHLPYNIGGYASSRALGTKYPAYKGSAISAQLPGLPLEDGNEKLTAPIIRAAQHVGSYLPKGTVLTSGWRTFEEQAALIVDFAGGLTDGDLGKAYTEASKDKLIAWVGDSPHGNGLAYDLSGASLSAIDAAVKQCQAEHPEDGIKGTILESGNNCVHVDVNP
jgi:hypothetical protein